MQQATFRKLWIHDLVAQFQRKFNQALPRTARLLATIV